MRVMLLVMIPTCFSLRSALQCSLCPPFCCCLWILWAIPEVCLSCQISPLISLSCQISPLIILYVFLRAIARYHSAFILLCDETLSGCCTCILGSYVFRKFFVLFWWANIKRSDNDLILSLSLVCKRFVTWILITPARKVVFIMHVFSHNFEGLWLPNVYN